jgi:hypothetical protein
MCSSTASIRLLHWFLLIGIGSVIGVAAGIAVILLAQGSHSLLHTPLTIFAWVALVGVVEGIWLGAVRVTKKWC